MFLRQVLFLLAMVAAIGTAPRALAVELKAPTGGIDFSQITGRWYEIARLPNRFQKDCQAGASDWSASADGYSVVQICHKGSVSSPATEWKGTAKILDPKNANRIKINYFGGLVSAEYWVLDSRSDQGWMLLGTPNGRYLWLMSQKPSLAASAKAQALARIKQLGYNMSALEFPLPARN